MRGVGASSPPFKGSMTTGAHGTARARGGEPFPRRTAAAGGGKGGPSLGAVRPVPSSVAIARASPARRRPCRDLAASVVSTNGSLRGLVLLSSCSPARLGFEGVATARCVCVPSSTGGGHGSTSDHEKQTLGSSPRIREVSIEGENRSLESVSARRSVVAEVVGRLPDPEKRLPGLSHG